MAWEKRGSRAYYYRVRRSNGRVLKEYVGPGPHAVAAAREDAQRRQARENDSEMAQEVVDAMLPSDELLCRLNASVDELVAHVLTRNGFHHHHGTWRPNARRHQSTADNH